LNPALPRGSRGRLCRPNGTTYNSPARSAGSPRPRAWSPNGRPHAGSGVLFPWLPRIGGLPYFPNAKGHSMELRSRTGDVAARRIRRHFVTRSFRPPTPGTSCRAFISRPVGTKTGSRKLVHFYEISPDGEIIGASARYQGIRGVAGFPLDSVPRGC
jgi:hypothetical protein